MLVFVFTLAFFTACDNASVEENKSETVEKQVDTEPTEVEKYVEKYRDEFDKYETGVDGSRMKLEVYAQEYSIVFEYTLVNVTADMITDETKDQMQKKFDGMKETLTSEIEGTRKRVPSFEGYIYKYYTEDGVFIGEFIAD